MDKLTVQEAVDSTNSVNAASKKLGIPRYKLQDLANSFGIKLKKNQSGKGISKKKKDGNGKFALTEILEGKHPKYKTNNLKWRLFEEGIKSNKCEECKVSDWNGKELICELDHINGNPKDHRLENLRILCPNCHSQTDTFCGRNKRN